jgi:hypothetical protein
MGPGYFIIAIFGCADGSAACAPAATVATRYESRAACSAAVNDALAANSDLDFPTLVAECRSGAVPAAAASNSGKPVPAGALRG